MLYAYKMKKNIFKFKIGKTKINIVRGRWNSFIHGGLCALGGYGIVAIIMRLSNFYNKFFWIGFGTIFGFILLIRTTEGWNKLFKNKKG